MRMEEVSELESSHDKGWVACSRGMYVGAHRGQTGSMCRSLARRMRTGCCYLAPFVEGTV